jgi:chromosome segregation ATPase
MIGIIIIILIQIIAIILAILKIEIDLKKNVKTINKIRKDFISTIDKFVSTISKEETKIKAMKQDVEKHRKKYDEIESDAKGMDNKVTGKQKEYENLVKLIADMNKYKDQLEKMTNEQKKVLDVNKSNLRTIINEQNEIYLEEQKKMRNINWYIGILGSLAGSLVTLLISQFIA